jgi:hypothetical protein
MDALFHERPGASLDEVQKEIGLAFRRLGDIVSHVLPAVEIRTAETRVAHGVGSVPSRWRVVRQAGEGTIYETRPADKKFLYLAKQAVVLRSGVVGDLQSLYRPDRYYIAGGPAAGVTITRGAVSTVNAHNRLWCWPRQFRRAGVITSIAAEWTGQAGAPKTQLFIYRPDPATPMLPGNRVYWTELTLPAFAGYGPSVALSLEVAAGETLWFGQIGSAAAVYSQPCVTVNAADLWPSLGQGWTPGNGRVPDTTNANGYRHAFTYAAEPPTTYPGGTTPTPVLNSDGACPAVMFAFDDTAGSSAGVSGLDTTDATAVVASIEVL